VKPRAPGNGITRFHQFSLLGLLASGYLAIAGSGQLDVASLWLAGAALLVRALLVVGLIRLPLSERAVTAAMLLYIGFYLVDYFFLTQDFLTATVHLVFFLAAVLVLTASTRRQYFFLKLLAFAQMLAASLLSANLTYFIFLATFLLFGVATLISSEILHSMETARVVARWGARPIHRRLTALSVFVALGILALTGSLFFLLPRTARAAFQHLVSHRFILPGFSNEVRLGQIGEIQQQSTPLMRVLFEQAPAPALKWRGAALNTFDGRRWFNERAVGQPILLNQRQAWLADFRQISRRGRRVKYEAHLKGPIAETLFFAGIPEWVRIDASMIIRTSGGGYRLGFANPQGVRYSAQSFLEAEPGTNESAPISTETMRASLALPPLDPRIAELARRVAAGASSDADRARRIEQHLQQDYAYTLELPARAAPDPLAHFLFERRRGHCEYFASAMAVMLRTVDIPSRVITGFQSGVFNPISGWQVIRASDAHSWVEAWLPDRGWTTFDPTPADPNASRPSLWTQLSLYLDAAETFWQDWVIGYDLDRQVFLADRMGQSSRSFSLDWVENTRSTWQSWQPWVLDRLKRYAAVVAPLLVALLAGFYLRKRMRHWWATRQHLRRVQSGQAGHSDAILLYQRMLRMLRKRGCEKPAWMTPVEFSRHVPAPACAIVSDLTDAYNALRFGGQRDAAPRMMALLDRLHRELR